MDFKECVRTNPYTQKPFRLQNSTDENPSGTEKKKEKKSWNFNIIKRAFTRQIKKDP